MKNSEMIVRSEMERNYFTSFNELNASSLQKAKIEAKTEHISKCLGLLIKINIKNCED